MASRLNGTDEDDELADLRSLRKRIADNPRPAIVWLVAGGILFALEMGRILGWIKALIGAVTFVGNRFLGLPLWVGRNVTDTLGLAAGTVAMIVAGVLLAYLAVTLLTTLGVRWGFAARLDLDDGMRREQRIDKLVATGVLSLFGALVMFTPLGGILGTEFDAFVTLLDGASSTLPSITSREAIPNQGHRTPDGGWEGTFLGLSPAWAWTIRVGLVLAYALALALWVRSGYRRYRTHYREAEWTPRDDTIRRFKQNYWGMFGLIVIGLFVVISIWAPAVSPAPVEHNVYEPFEHELEYLNDETGEVETVPHGIANLNSHSDGQTTVKPLSYDDYDRWAPLGTTDRGQDMMTHLAYGARTSLTIGVTGIGLAGGIAVFLSLLTAYYKGLADIATVITTDSIIAIPALLLIMMVMQIFQDASHPLAEPLDGGLLLALVFGMVYWPGIWRAIRGPSLRVAEQEWVDAARSYGQTPLSIMRMHMAPYIAGYVMIYASLLLGGVIIFTAALTFLGLGINPPTPEWGRLIANGEQFVSTSSFHVATIPGLAIAFVVVGFNALGDGLRDAIDPEADIGDGDAAAAGGGG